MVNFSCVFIFPWIFELLAWGSYFCTSGSIHFFYNTAEKTLLYEYHTILKIDLILYCPQQFAVLYIQVEKNKIVHFRCALPNYPNDTYEIQSEYHQHLINLTIPENEEKDVDYDQCHVNINGTKTKCSKWVYSTEIYKSTFTSEVSLIYNIYFHTKHIQFLI